MYSLTLALGVGITAGSIALLIFKRISDLNLSRFSFKLKIPEKIKKPDIFEQWVNVTEQRIRNAEIRINVARFILASSICSTLAFLLGMYLFQNLPASLFLGASFLIIPEHILSLIENKRKQKVHDQLVRAIRIFTSEFIQTPQLEKGFAAVAARVEDPIGKIFNKAYQDLLIGTNADYVLASMMGRLNTEHGRMFVQLLTQARKDASISALFPELIEKVETNLALARLNHTNLAGERILALIMACIPVPVYLFTRMLVPEAQYFVTETLVGRIIITLAFLSLFIWAIMDRLMGRVHS